MCYGRYTGGKSRYPKSAILWLPAVYVARSLSDGSIETRIKKIDSYVFGIIAASMLAGASFAQSTPAIAQGEPALSPGSVNSASLDGVTAERRRERQHFQGRRPLQPSGSLRRTPGLRRSLFYFDLYVPQGAQD